MPNWSFTNISITAIESDKNKLEKLYRDIKEWTSKEYVKSDFGKNWLGNIVGFSGIDSNKDGDFKVRCRGTLEDIELSDNTLHLRTETAWSPMFGMWLQLLDKYQIQHEGIIFDSYDDMGNYYITNDSNYIGRYIIDGVDNEVSKVTGLYENEWDASEDTVISMLQKLLDTGEEDITELLDMLSESEWSDSLYITPWEESNVEDNL